MAWRAEEKNEKKEIRILLVEDDKSYGDYFSKILQSAGLKVDLVERGLDGIKKIKESHYDLVITDIVMPDINGVELLKRTKSFNPFQNVIMLTADTGLEYAINSLREGACDYLLKGNINIKNVLETIYKHLNTKSLMQKLKIEKEEIEKRTSQKEKELREKEQKIARISKVLRSIKELGSKVHQIYHYKDLIELFEKIIPSAISVKHFMLFLYDQSANEFILFYPRNKDKKGECRVPFQDGLFLTTIRKNAFIYLPRIIEGIYQLPNLDIFKQNKQSPLLIMPLKNRQNKIQGMMVSIGYENESFSEEECNLLEALAIKISVSLENIRLPSIDSSTSLLFKQQENGKTFTRIIGSSPQMREIFALINKVAKIDSTVLITGESGTGKEVIARAIHERSHRAEKRFVPVNCGAIPHELLESELFGYVRGSFTGAVKDKIGLFEEAKGGTIFLDEISELPLSLQVKLLRFLQDQLIRPVGGLYEYSIDVRLIAATNKNLENLVAEGKFREDLYYRLNVIQIQVPPLREREGDIIELAEYFLQLFNRKFHKDIQGFETETIEILLRHNWPGNVRELENAIERAVAFEDSPFIKPSNLPSSIKRNIDFKEEMVKTTMPLGMAIQAMERSYLIKVLNLYNWKKKDVAKALNIDLATLYRKMIKYNITRLH